MNNQAIRTVAEYLACVRDIEISWDDEINKNMNIPQEDKAGMKYFFRGHADKDWLLRSSLFRKLPSSDETFYRCDIQRNSYYTEEQYIIQEAVRLYPEIFNCAMNDVARMTVCQHYALPTRLLDISGNALVALYFAVTAEDSRDGVVYVFRANCEDYKIASTSGTGDKITISEYHKQYGKIISSEGKPLLIFPAYKTARQRAQDGAFYLMENKVNPFRLCEFSKDDFRTIEILQTSKRQLKQELEDICNIHTGTLFPESLDGCVDKLKREAERRVNA